VQSKIDFLLNKYKEFLEALHNDEGRQVSQLNYSQALVRWEAVPGGWYILNTDGASKGNPGPARGGGVLRDDKGDWKWGFTMNMGHCSSMKAELKAVLKGLQVAKERGVQKLWIKSDSCVLVGMLRGELKTHPAYGVVIKQCKDLLRAEGWETKITHCYREANLVADKLANLGVILDGNFMLFECPPREVLDVLFADAVGVGWPRLIRN